jgi:hypothetical protein
MCNSAKESEGIVKVNLMLQITVTIRWLVGISTDSIIFPLMGHSFKLGS